jgi:hypothetical protein
VEENLGGYNGLMNLTEGGPILGMAPRTARLSLRMTSAWLRLHIDLSFGGEAR